MSRASKLSDDAPSVIVKEVNTGVIVLTSLSVNVAGRLHVRGDNCCVLHVDPLQFILVQQCAEFVR